MGESVGESIGEKNNGPGFKDKLDTGNILSYISEDDVNPCTTWGESKLANDNRVGNRFFIMCGVLSGDNGSNDIIWDDGDDNSNRGDGAECIRGDDVEFIREDGGEFIWGNGTEFIWKIY